MFGAVPWRFETVCSGSQRFSTGSRSFPAERDSGRDLWRILVTNSWVVHALMRFLSRGGGGGGGGDEKGGESGKLFQQIFPGSFSRILYLLMVEFFPGFLPRILFQDFFPGFFFRILGASLDEILSGIFPRILFRDSCSGSLEGILTECLMRSLQGFHAFS